MFMKSAFLFSASIWGDHPSPKNKREDKNSIMPTNLSVEC
jgi:hypothetical protein